MLPFSLRLPGPATIYPGCGPTSGWENIPAFSLKYLVMVPKSHAWCVEGGRGTGGTKTAHPLGLDALLTHSVRK